MIATAQREELASHEELYIREVFLRDRAYSSATQGPQPFLDRAVNTFALAAEYDVGIGKISSVTSSQNRKLTRVLQGRNTPEDQDGLAQELRFAFDNGGKITGVAGAFVQDTEFTRRDPGFTGFFGPSQNNVDSRSYALFGEATYKVIESVDVTAGLRWSREEASIDYARSGTGAFSFDSEDNFSDISPKGAVGWQFAPRHRLYAVVARGFKPGGFNHTVSVPADAIPYESETSTNYEIGWRGAAFGGAVEFGTALYYIKAKDKQIYVGPLGAQVLRNVGDAESRGIEFDVQARPIDSLILTFGGSYGRSVFDGAVDPQTGVSYDGNRLPYAPDTTLQGSARYIIPQTAMAGELSLRGAATYFSKTYFNETNTLDQGGYTIMDVSLDVAFDSGLSLSLFADNLTDKLYRTSSFLFAGGDQRSTIGTGRVIGLVARMTF
jgi:pesticin/yersiniabactin receptor